MASSRTASMSRRSRSSPPSRRNAAKYCAGSRTSGSKRPASRSCPAEKPLFPFATIFLSPSRGRCSPPTGRATRDPRLPRQRIAKERIRDENASARKLGPLIPGGRGLQGFLWDELDDRGGAAVGWSIRPPDGDDRSDENRGAVRSHEPTHLPPVPFSREARSAEEYPGPGE